MLSKKFDLGSQLAGKELINPIVKE